MDMYKIQRAELKDVKLIQNLNKLLFEKEYNEYDKSLDCERPFSKEGEEYFKESITNEDNLCLVAKEKTEIVGYLIGSIQETTSRRKIKKIWELENMFIKKEWRTKWMGKKLHQEFIQWCKQKEVEKISVIVSAKNTDGRKFYNKCWFEEYDITLEKKI